MNQPMQWRRQPKPDVEVLKLAEQVSEAAQLGQIRAIAVATINPTLEIECDCAGDMDPVKKTLLIGALTQLIHKLSK